MDSWFCRCYARLQGLELSSILKSDRHEMEIYFTRLFRYLNQLLISIFKCSPLTIIDLTPTMLINVTWNLALKYDVDSVLSHINLAFKVLPRLLSRSLDECRELRKFSPLRQRRSLSKWISSKALLMLRSKLSSSCGLKHLAKLLRSSFW